MFVAFSPAGGWRQQKEAVQVGNQSVIVWQR
jgi:hypothetical protein